ncbi:hypothetical protein HHI36_002190 [Cryptolaemus montrouzieri]|uniref:Uncharacterized protein n=1 Tax=Cryptolaemus montrouzieri TaxID=559131 RepID=A0ABD2PAG6_9CUCU
MHHSKIILQFRDDFHEINDEKIIPKLKDNFRLVHMNIQGLSFSLSTPDRNASALLDVLGAHGLKRTIFEPTRIKNCIDNVFVDYRHDKISASVVNMSFSDHKAQLVRIENSVASVNTVVMDYYRPLTEEGFQDFQYVLADLQWEFADDPNLLAVKARRKTNSGVRWFTDELRKMKSEVELLNEMFILL